MPDLPDLDRADESERDTHPHRAARVTPTARRRHTPPVDLAGRVSRAPGRGLLSGANGVQGTGGSGGAQRSALETPDWLQTDPATEPLLETRPRLPRAGIEPTAPGAAERWEERFGGVRSAVGSALGSAGERVRAAVPQS